MNFSIRLPLELYRRLKREAERLYTSKAAIIKQALDAYLPPIGE